jgi:protoporphyrinogen oxidase
LSPERLPLVVLGAGPAGLAAALQLARRGHFAVTVLERGDRVGGNAGSFDLDGLRVDYGSHRLHPSCPPRVLADLRALLGPDLLERPRHGRIRLRGRWLDFPLKPLNLARNLPVRFLLGVARDAVRGKGRSKGPETFAAVLRRGLGKTICRDFYFPYAEKIWGVPAAQLDAEQARRRVSAGSLKEMIGKLAKAVPGLRPPGKGKFLYPRHGYGQISDAFHRAARVAGADVFLGTTVTGIELDDGRAVAVLARGEGGERRWPACQVFSTIPLPHLVRAVLPAASPEVLAAAAALRFRALILTYLVLETEQFSEFDAHYFPEAGIAISRLSEPKNYGLAPLPGRTVLCAELPCSPQDAVWKASDQELAGVVLDSLARAGQPVRVPVRRVAVRRLPQAYPVYARDYRQHFQCLDRWVNGVEGLLTFGRQGLFVHDNAHHTLAMAYALGECVGADGRFDRGRWGEHRRQFETFVVED